MGEILSCVIIDDEPGARETLEVMLERYCPNVKIIGTAGSVSDGIDLLNNLNPNLVFLDIEMPKGTGFDLIEKVDKINFDIVFTTAYDKYALRAIKVSAIDYLLKPIDPNDLKDAVLKAGKKKSTEVEQSLQFLRSYLTKDEQVNQIAVPTIEGLEVIEISDIIYLKGSRNYTEFYTINKKYTVSRTLKEYEEIFNSYEFIRIHQSHIINLKHLKKYLKGRGGEVVMSNGINLEVSRNRKDDLLRKLSL